MGKKLKGLLLALVLCLQVVVPAAKADAATVIYNNKTGTEGAYNYELWKDYGDTSMTLKGNGLFECWWENIGNALFRKGIKWDCTKTYSQLGNITVNYGVDYQPNGNSYLCVYGWCRNPLVEYYIVESWGTWRPPGATSKGTITVDGGTYDVYETTRVNQPSIDGNTTFQQYWSVRTSKRTSGTISVTEHFKAWERMGMKMGLMYEAALTVEGYQSSGWADVYKFDITVGGSSNSGSSSSGSSNSGSNSGNSGSSATNTGSTMECENMTKSGQYTGNISSPFNGVALYANNDAVSYTQNFTSSTNTFTLRGASNNNNMAKVDLYIGNEKKGTFYYGDANAANYVIENVSTGTGNKTVKLVVSADDGQWDAYLDKLTISGGASSGGTTNGGTTSSGNTNSGNTSNGTTSGGTTNSGTASTSNSKECEAMTKSGQYTGTISNPFNGIALYANNDAVSYTQYFAEGSHDFTLRGASNGSNMAKVDLVIGGQTKGTFYFGDANVAEYTIKNVSHGTGNQTIKLVVTADDGKWDAYIDKLTISAAGSSSSNNSSSSSGNTNSGSSSINPNGKMIALTFDDGPSSTTTQVLDVLDKYGVKATFFLIGQNINNNTKSILQRQSNSGHELANHSYTHSDMTTMSWSAIQNEINQTNNLIKQYTGQTPKFFRPPYISVNSTMYSAIDMAFIQGSMHNDWDGSSSSSQIANSVIQSAKDGQIILLHDFNGNNATVQALPTIIENLKNQGYQFVTLSQLFEYKGKNANVDNKIWSNVYN